MNPIQIFAAVLAAVCVVFAVVSPRRDRAGAKLPGLFFLLAAILLSVLSTDPIYVCLGWWLTLAPFALGLFGPEGRRKGILGALAVSALP